MSETLRLTVVYQDAGDGWVMASIPELPEILTQGATVDGEPASGEALAVEPLDLVIGA